MDLKEAYDRVDRSILLCKLEKLNFSRKLIEFLKSYYENDFITTELEGEYTNKQF